MKNKYSFVFVMLLFILAGSLGLTTLYVANEQKEEKDDFQIVTSFYPMYIAALNIVGDTENVALTNLSEPQTGCLHDFQMTPEDMKLLSRADVFIINGGGIESFMEEVAETYPELEVIEATSGIELLEEGSEESFVVEDEELEASREGHVHEHDHDHEENAHAWMSISAYRVMVATMAEQLATLDEIHAKEYLLNAQIYDAKLQDLQEEQQECYGATEGTNIILVLEAYAYVADEYGLNVCYELNLDEERQVGAGEVADVLAVTESDGVKYILAEELYGKEIGNTIEKESNVTVLYLDTLNRGKYEKDSYIDAMHNNIELLKQAFIN